MPNKYDIILNNTMNATKNIVLRILFIIAIIAVIFILAFAIIKFIPMLFSGFASVGNLISSPFKSNEINVSVNDSSLVDGDKFQIGWEYETDKSGSFYLTHKCIDNLKISAIEQNGQKTVLCNTRYPLPQNVDIIELAVNYTKANSFTDLPLEISFIENSNNTVIASGETTITVQDSINPTPIGTIAGATITAGQVTTETGSSAGTTTPAPIYSAAPADLAIINADPINDLDVQFVVRNIGGQNTGNWIFSYSTPGEGTENSPSQPNLRPGDTIKYVLKFDSGTPEGKTTIILDPNGNIRENSESNNRAIIDIGGDENGSGIGSDYNKNDDADLQIEDFKVGRMSGSKFVEDDEIDEDDDAAIQFVVVNRGGEKTGSWKFKVTNLPYDDDDEYESKNQKSLAPGESVLITVELENPDEGDYNIRLEVDSDDDVDEEKENNNTDSESLEVSN
jgi:hypothetical protein